MNLKEIFDYEFGIFELITNYLDDTSLNFLLCSKKWNENINSFIIKRLIENTIENIELKKSTIIIPWKTDYPDEPKSLIKFIKSFNKDILIFYNKKWMLTRITQDDKGINYPPIPMIQGCFYRNIDPQYFNLIAYLTDKNPISRSNIYQEEYKCNIGTYVCDPEFPVLYWDHKNYLLVPPNLYKDLCNAVIKVEN